VHTFRRYVWMDTGAHKSLTIARMHCITSMEFQRKRQNLALVIHALIQKQNRNNFSRETIFIIVFWHKNATKYICSGGSPRLLLKGPADTILWRVCIAIYQTEELNNYRVSETGFCLRLKVEPSQLGPINEASPYLRTLAPTQDRIYKPTIAQTICES
jgi:hypothetical protein